MASSTSSSFGVATRSKRQRYVAKIKNVCLAIPFDGDRTLAEFENEVAIRITKHRKLKNDINLNKQRNKIIHINIINAAIRYIKIGP